MGYPCPENLGVAPQKKGHGGCSPKSHFFVVSSLQSFFCSLQRQRTMPKSSLQSTQRDSCKVLRKIAKIQFHTTRGGGINHVYSHLFHVRRNHAFPTFSCMFAKFTLIPTFCCAKNCEICIFFAKLLQCSHFCCMFAKITLIPTFCCMFAEITCIPSTPKASRSS